MVGQLFVQIYPAAACSGMVQRFAENYRRASVPVAGQESPRSNLATMVLPTVSPSAVSPNLPQPGSGSPSRQAKAEAIVFPTPVAAVA